MSSDQFSAAAQKSRPESFVHAQISENGSVTRPQCHGQPMADAGDCGQGCCDDYRCGVCGYKVRVEWPD